MSEKGSKLMKLPRRFRGELSWHNTAAIFFLIEKSCLLNDYIQDERAPV